MPIQEKAKKTRQKKNDKPGARPSKNKGQRDLAATRKRILTAAAREFALKGLEGARIDRIAGRSGSNKAMIYYIFGGKEDLHLAVLENLFEEKTRSLDIPLLDDR